MKTSLFGQTTLVLFISLFMGLAIAFMREQIGYQTPDELYFTNLENLGDSYFRYGLPIIVFSSLSFLGFVGVFLFHWLIAFYSLRKINPIALAVLMVSPGVLFFASSFLRDFVISVIIVHIIFIPSTKKKLFILFLGLLILRPEHFVITVASVFAAYITSRHVVSFLMISFSTFLFVLLITAFSMDSIAPIIKSGAMISDMDGRYYGVLQNVQIESVALLDVLLNYFIAVFSIPIRVDGFNFLAFSVSMVVKVISISLIFFSVVIHKKINVKILMTIYFLIFSFPIAAFVSHELSLYRWFLPVYFLLVCAGASSFNSKRTR